MYPRQKLNILFNGVTTSQSPVLIELYMSIKVETGLGWFSLLPSQIRLSAEKQITTKLIEFINI